MKKELFTAVFEKAKNQTGKSKPNSLSKHLSWVFTEDLKLSISSITFVRYYKKYIENDRNISYNPNTDLLNKASEYLGYDSYEDFVMGKKQEKEGLRATVISIDRVKESQEKENKTDREEQNEEHVVRSKLSIWIKNNNRIIIINTTILILVSVLVSSGVIAKKSERWMQWQDDRYVEVEFELSKYYKDLLIPYNKEQLENFKKITNPNCDTKYFTEKGKAITWYYKKGKGNLEIFTAPGSHPTNGKNLKAITPFMIREYLCEGY